MRLDVYHHYPPDPATDRRLDAIRDAIATLDRKVNRLMTTVDEISAKLDAAAAREIETQTALAAIRQDIADIKASIPTSGGATQEQLDALGAKVDALGAAVDATATAAQALDSENPGGASA